MRKRKLNLSRNNKFKRKLLINFIIVIIILLVGYFGVRYLGETLKNLDYFTVTDIVVRGQEESGELSYLKGHNIFTIDLRKESRHISRLYPTYKKIRLIRFLPNRLFVDFIKRRPLAIVKLYRNFYVDEDLMLFDLLDKSEEADLPIILGLDTKIFGPRPGRIYNVGELLLALNIIKEMGRNKLLKSYKIKEIDVAHPGSASFIASGNLEIRIGGNNIQDKINILSSLLMQVKDDLNNIKYIDLRFKEPVIKFK